MAVALSTLVTFLRVSIDDALAGYQENTDAELIELLRMGIQVQEGSWNQGYSVVVNNTDPDNPVTEITPDPPVWLQMLYVIKTALMMKSFKATYSYDNGAVKVTRTSKKEDLEALQKLYDEILDEQKYANTCFAFNSWDDYLTRRDKILNRLGLSDNGWQ